MDQQLRDVWRQLQKNPDDSVLAQEYAALLSRKGAASRWVHQGSIPVDCGQMAIGSSGYVATAVNRWYGQLLASQGGTVKAPNLFGPNGVTKLGDGLGGAMAMLISSGFGDGSYDVYVRYTEKTKRPAEVRIVFVPDGQDRCENCEFGRITHRKPDGSWLREEVCSKCQGTGMCEAIP